MKTFVMIQTIPILNTECVNDINVIAENETESGLKYFEIKLKEDE